MSRDAFTRLERLRGRVTAARSAEADARTSRGRALRATAAAQGALQGYYEDVGTNDDRDPNPEQERRLIDALEAARADASEEVWQARTQAAEQVRENAERSLEQFGEGHFAELAAELAREAPALRDRLQGAHDELEAAEIAYMTLIRRWHRIAAYGHLLPEDVPGDPLRGEPGDVAARFAAGIEPPIPRSLRTETAA